MGRARRLTGSSTVTATTSDTGSSSMYKVTCYIVVCKRGGITASAVKLKFGVVFVRLWRVQTENCSYICILLDSSVSATWIVTAQQFRTPTLSNYLPSYICTHSNSLV